MDIHPIPHLTLEMLQPLLDSSIEEGYGFIQKLWDEYESGKTTFQENGAALLGVGDKGQLVAIGGCTPDPYLDSAAVGRIRHVYVLPEYRRHGLGRQLVEALITHGAGQFTTITLRTQTEHGCAFYEALGFSNTPRFENATHWLDVEQHAWIDARTGD